MKTKIKKEGFLKTNLSESWSFVSESRRYIYFAFAVFALFIIIGAVFPTPAMLDSQIKQIIAKLGEKITGLDTVHLIWFIFTNNLLVSAVGIFAGIFFGIASFIAALSNGYVLGYVIKKLIEKLGLGDGALSLWRLIPHGIFELPAVMISLGLGLRLGASLFSSLNKNSLKNYPKLILSSIRAFIFIVIPLLLVAAIIEGVLIGILK